MVESNEYMGWGWILDERGDPICISCYLLDNLFIYFEKGASVGEKFGCGGAVKDALIFTWSIYYV